MPKLLLIACDAWEIPLGELAMAAGLEQTVLAQFAMGTRPLSEGEQKAVMSEMAAMVKRREIG